MGFGRVKAVIDTNVLVSGLIRSDGYPGRILEAVRTARLVLCADSRILDEYQFVMLREKFSKYFHQCEVHELMDFFAHGTHRVRPDFLIDELPDRSDAPFLEVASMAEVPLVTGNTKHFPAEICQGVEICDPKTFCQRYLKRV